MEVVMPISSPSHDFYFPSNSLYTSAPASPKPFGNPSSEHCYFLSAPASPRGSSFNWEEKPEADAFDFAFEFSGEVEGEAPAAADDLFEGGRIRPLNCSSLRQSSTKSREEIELRQGRGKEKGAAADAIQKINLIGNSSEIASGGERGRGRAPASASGGYARGRRAARSLSPLRGRDGEFENSRNSAAPSSTSLMRGCGSTKWSLKDLFLFRSASDGRVIGRGSKDPLRKYTLLPSFASSSSSSSPSPSSSSFTPPSKVKKNGEAGATTTSRSGKGSMASVHETHYTANRAASEEMKKKTPLPFHRNSLFGYLRFNPAINSVGRRLNSFSLHRGRS